MKPTYKGLPLDLIAEPVADPGKYGTWPLGTRAWTWASEAGGSGYVPQGITSFRDSDTKEDVVLVSWHSAEDTNLPPRLSYLKRAGTHWFYGSALLQGKDVTPELHAGGIAFFANRLLVADTNYGLLAFDATRPSLSGDILGVWGIQQTGRFPLAAQIANPPQRKFSFADIDWSEPKRPVLLTGVYASKGDGLQPGLFAWTLGADGPLIQPPTDCLPCAQQDIETFRYIQGATRRGDTWYLSQSSDIAAITRYDTAPCEAPPPKTPLARCALGLEDLHIPQDGRVLRGLTENVSDEEQKLGPRLLFEIPL